MNLTKALAPRLAGGFDRWDRLLSERVRRSVTTWGLAVVFVMITVERTISAYTLGYLAVDLKIYRAAAAAAITGGDPWRAGAEGLTFAGAPPALIAYLPAALLSEGLAIVVYGLLSIVAAVVVLRALRLPPWWLLFPPLAESIVVLNSDVFVVALLVAGRRWAFAAIVFKVYAAVPLLLQRRWLSLVIGAAVCAVSVPLVAQFIADRELISSALDTQSSGGLSAWGSWVMVPAVVALLALLGRGAEWLSVPAVWPYTQLHYNVLAMPVAATSPIVAFLLCFAVWPLPAVAAIVYALQVVLLRLAGPYRVGAVKTAPSSSA